MQKVAFVDRDGTFLSEPEKPEGVDSRETFPLKSMEEFQYMDGGIEGLKTLADKGYKLVLVTNQTFLGTPKHPKKMFDKVMNRIKSDLATKNAEFAYIMICPHGPDDGCDCRKPSTGGIKRFLSENPDINFAQSLMFGDRDTDRQFEENLGVRFVKIETNKEFVLPSDI